jgi:4-amino-4-deoxy-L-arabinose transferase-like glycosyltransferase
MLTNAQYGLFFDEFYYYSMSYHLSLGYLDAPPVTGALMALSRLLLGDSVASMRVFPALAGCFTMLFAALTARKMGGGRFAQALTALAVMLAPMFMTFSGMFTYDAFDQLMSAMVIFMVAKIVMGEATPRTWILFGFIAGIGLMVKITMGFLLVCLVVGILLTRARKYLAGKWVWISAAIAVGCCVPFILWQVAHGFPIVEYLLDYKGARTVSPSASTLFQFVFVVMNPAAVLLWLGGLILLFTKRGRAFRPFAWAFLAYFALAAVLSVKFYALAGALLPLVAFGSVCLEKNYRSAPLPVEEKKQGKAAWILKTAYVLVICLLGVAFIPLSIPVLSPQATAQYDQEVGYSKYVTWDTVAQTGIITYFAGRLGWGELAQSLSDVYHSLPQDEQKDCAVCCGLYGEVGAMDYYDRKDGLPEAISPDLGCYYWGDNNFDGKCMLFLNMGSNYFWELESDFETVQIVSGSAGVPYSTLSLGDRSIFICRGLKIPVEEFWKKMRSAT